MKQKIKKRLERKCVVCGGTIRAIVYTNRKIRGGHYFGKIPLHRKSELRKMRQSGTHKSKITKNWIVDVYNYDPKPYAHAEHWECPSCCWHPKTRVNLLNTDALRFTKKEIRSK